MTRPPALRTAAAMDEIHVGGGSKMPVLVRALSIIRAAGLKPRDSRRARALVTSASADAANALAMAVPSAASALRAAGVAGAAVSVRVVGAASCSTCGGTLGQIAGDNAVTASVMPW